MVIFAGIRHDWSGLCPRAGVGDRLAYNRARDGVGVAVEHCRAEEISGSTDLISASRDKNLEQTNLQGTFFTLCITVWAMWIVWRRDIAVDLLKREN